MLDRVVKRRGLKTSLHQSNRGQTLLRMEFPENVGLFEGDVEFEGIQVGPIVGSTTRLVGSYN